MVVVVGMKTALADEVRYSKETGRKFTFQLIIIVHFVILYDMCKCMQCWHIELTKQLRNLLGNCTLKLSRHELHKRSVCTHVHLHGCSGIMQAVCKTSA